jgi:hypothetical protein
MYVVEYSLAAFHVQQAALWRVGLLRLVRVSLFPLSAPVITVTYTQSFSDHSSLMEWH